MKNNHITHQASSEMEEEAYEVAKEWRRVRKVWEMFSYIYKQQMGPWVYGI